MTHKLTSNMEPKSFRTEIQREDAVKEHKELNFLAGKRKMSECLGQTDGHPAGGSEATGSGVSCGGDSALKGVPWKMCKSKKRNVAQK